MMELPQSIQELSRVIGLSLTLRLVSISKNYRIYIPKRSLHEDHPIVRAVGIPAAEKLRECFGGELMSICQCRHYHSHQRNVEIAREWVRGERSINELAKCYGVHPRTVDRALSTVTTSDLNAQPLPLPTPPVSRKKGGLGPSAGGPCG